MKKCIIFRKNAVVKTLVNQLVIDIDGCDKHEIEAFVKNLILSKYKFILNLLFQGHPIFFNLNFKTVPFLKILKNEQNCSLSWPHKWQVSFWDLN
jgi:hypothetical protein